MNKTPLSHKANRKIGGNAPSSYIAKLQSDKNVGLSDESMDAVRSSHALSPVLLRADQFSDFIEDSHDRLSALVASEMGKGVSRGVES